MRFAPFALLLVASASLAATGSGGGRGTGGRGAGWAPSPTNGVTGGPSGRAGSTGTRMQMLDPRNPPPLAPARKVTPQDCSKPIDLDGGNLSCR